VTLGADTTLATTDSSAVSRLTSAVNSDAASTPRALTLTASGASGKVVFDAAVGALAPLSTLALTASDISLNAGTVTSTAAQTYTGPLTLGADTTLTGVGITLGSNGGSNGSNHRQINTDKDTTQV